MPSSRRVSLLMALLAMTGFDAHAQMHAPPAADEYGTGQSRAGPPPRSETLRQGPKGPPIRELTELLGLNQTQADALDGALRQRHAQKEAMRQRTDEQRKAAMDASDGHLRKLLTPAQYGTFRQWEAQRRERHNRSDEGGRRPPPKA